MNHVLFSGFLTRTELIIRCRLLNKTALAVINAMKFESKSQEEEVLYYDKGKKGTCFGCNRKRIVPQDPFRWVSGLRCKKCMPRTITRTNAKKMMKKELKHMKHLRTLSPFGRQMSLFLFADLITEMNTSKS